MIAKTAFIGYPADMPGANTRKYNKTKFEGVFFRESAKRDPHTGKPDLIYAFWYQDAEGRGHWKTVGRHSEGVRPSTARTARARFLAEFNATGVNPLERDKVTVGQVVDAYTAWALNEGKYVDRTYVQYKSHLKAKIHSIPIVDLTPNFLSSIKSFLLDEDAHNGSWLWKENIKNSADAKPVRKISSTTVNMILGFVRAAINHAIATNMWNGKNPLASVGGKWKMPKLNNKRLRFLTREEARALLDDLSARHPQLHDMALLSLRTGLRPTEIFKLRGQDIDAVGKGVHIIQKGGDRVFVRIPEDMIEMLLAYKRKPTEPIFQRPHTGTEFKQTPACFRSAIKKLHLEPEDGNSLYTVTLHTMRHTFASWLAQSGKVSLLELQKLMRHKNVSMTMRYAHLLPGQADEKLGIISDILGRDG